MEQPGRVECCPAKSPLDELDTALSSGWGSNPVVLSLHTEQSVGGGKARKLHTERNKTGTITSVGARNGCDTFNRVGLPGPCRSRCVQLSRCWAVPTDISIPAGNKAVTQRPPTPWDREIRGEGSHRNPSAITLWLFLCCTGQNS